jgi:hypothetical protein
MHPTKRVLIILLIHTDLQHGQDLFNYTRGRFVHNEEHEMSQRHVRFNVNELARCAAEAVGAKACNNISKYRTACTTRACC